MNSKFWLSANVSKALEVGSFLVFVVAEAVVIAASLKLPKPISPSVVRSLLLNVFLTCAPGAVGVHGYKVVNRIRSKFDAQREDPTFVWLSRQFLAATIVAYGVIVSNVVSLTDVFRPS